MKACILILLILCLCASNSKHTSRNKTSRCKTSKIHTSGYHTSKNHTSRYHTSKNHTARYHTSKNHTSRNYTYNTRIIEGTFVILGQYPYQVSLKVGKNIYKNFCGGVIIGPKKILTAAHCFMIRNHICRQIFYGKYRMRKFTNMYVVGANLRNTGMEPPYEDSLWHGQWRRISKVIPHPGYDFPTADICILYVKRDYEFGVFVNYINPAIITQDYFDKSCYSSGYGLYGDKVPSGVLRRGSITLIPKYECSLLNRRNMEKFICGESYYVDAAKGDSGGPLTCSFTWDPNSSIWFGVLVGLVCGKRGQSTFYTRVSIYYDWIVNDRGTSLNESQIYIKCIAFIVQFILSTFLR